MGRLLRADRGCPAAPLRLPGRGLAFFGFFAEPSPELDRRATAAVRAALDVGGLEEKLAHTYGGLLQPYEAVFRDTLAALS
ncbi:hypothetical protein [Streptomyces sp. NPDC058964]|uniref:hypothetical protein n=1 Tax=Streptomyces sp. NPDC058964 TaxID=3346681 RepID=UPI0036BDE21B